MNKLSEEEMERAAIDSFSYRNTNVEAWGIFLNGRMIQLASGKSLWTKKQFASSALTNHLYSVAYRSGWKPAELNQMLQYKGIVEIKKL